MPVSTLLLIAKCIICRQPSHWVKTCPNKDKPPQSAYYKCQQLGHQAALWPKSCWRTTGSELATGFQMVAYNQSKVGLRRPPTPSTSQPHHKKSPASDWSRRYTWTWQVRQLLSFLDTGATYSVLTSFFGPFSSWTYIIFGVTVKPISQYLTPSLYYL